MWSWSAGSLRSAVVLVALALSGCGAAPAVTLLSPAVSGAPAVAEFVGGENSESYWVARHDDVVDAARRSGERFALTLARDDANAERTLLVFSDTAKTKLRLHIEERTPALTYVRFNGPSGMARLLSRQMAEELDAADAFLVDWDEERGAFTR